MTQRRHSVGFCLGILISLLILCGGASAAGFRGNYFLRYSKGKIVTCGKVSKIKWVSGILSSKLKFTSYSAAIKTLQRSLHGASNSKKKKIRATVNTYTRLSRSYDKVCRPGPRNDYFLPTPVPTFTAIPNPTPQLCNDSIKGQRALCPVVFRASEQAAPGDYINIQGGGFDTDDQVILQNVNQDGSLDDAGAQVLPVISQSVGLLQVRIPLTIPHGVWSIRIKNGLLLSQNVYVNKPILRMTDSSSIRPDSPFRIYGKNLVHTASDISHVSASLQSGGATYPVTVLSGDQFELRVQAPHVIPIGQYTLVVNNGFGGIAGDGRLAAIDVQSAAVDVFDLGIGWGGDYAALSSNVYNVKTDGRLTTKAIGNGVTNDGPAIQAAVIKAGQAGGGVVYLPAGNYYIDASLSSILIGYSNVVIQGAGKDSTYIKFGSTPNLSLTVFSLSEKTSLNGFADFTFENVNTGDFQNKFIRQYSKGTLEKLFFKNIRFTMRAAGSIGFGDVHNLLFTRCDFSSTSTHNSALYAPGNEQIIVRDSVINYCTGRNAFQKSQGLIIEDSQFNRDIGCVSSDQIETGGIESSFVKNGVIKNNTVCITGDTTSIVTNDSEMILTQQGPYPFTYDGTVTSATASSLSDTGKNWSDPNVFVNTQTVPPVLVITGGVGVGQVRHIVGHDATTIQIDTPWDVIPAPTSTFAVTSLTAESLLIIDNQIQNGKSGISLYDGGYNVVVYGNTLMNTGGLGLRAQDRKYTGLNEQNIGWNNILSNNTVITTHGVKPGGFYMAMSHVGTEVIRPGTVLANEARDNTLVVSTSDVINGYGAFESIKYISAINEGGGFVAHSTVPAIIGSIYSRNTTVGAPYVELQGGGTSQGMFSAE